MKQELHSFQGNHVIPASVNKNIQAFISKCKSKGHSITASNNDKPTMLCKLSHETSAMESHGDGG